MFRSAPYSNRQAGHRRLAPERTRTDTLGASKIRWHLEEARYLSCPLQQGRELLLSNREGLDRTCPFQHRNLRLCVPFEPKTLDTQRAIHTHSRFQSRQFELRRILECFLYSPRLA